MPRLRDEPVIGFDTETKDPNLLTKGPGWATGDGHVVGFSVSVPDGRKWYIPIRHEVGGLNLDIERVMRWAREELTRPGQLTVGANLMYDLGWMLHEGISIPGPYYDVQWAEALLDEHRLAYNLNSLSSDYINEVKPDQIMWDWAARAYGGEATESAQKGNMHKIPAKLVGPYAEWDADAPLRIRQMQMTKIKADGLEELCDMEHKLIPMLLRMRKNGVRVDHEAAKRADVELTAEIDQLQMDLDSMIGRPVNVDSKEDLKAIFDASGISYPYTKPTRNHPSGQPSFTKPWLERCEHPAAKSIVELRNLDKTRGTFVRGYMLDYTHKGRIHCELHPLRSDDGGTVSGRYSSSNPNLQNIPSRNERMKKLLRGMFLPEEGERWVSMDYSQIEYRLLVHAAKGDAGAMARRMFCDDPSTDYHEFTGKLVERTLNRKLPRKPVKNINFGTIFGMGNNKLKSMLGLSDAEAEEFFFAYNAAIPYAMETREAAAKYAQEHGYIRTIFGRLARFPFWESSDYETSQIDGYMTYEEAVDRYGPRRIKRARSHKALNSYTQGGGADIMKGGMVALWEAGLFEVLTPLLTVHDEMNVSAPFTKAGDEALREMKHLMEHIAPMLKVPLLSEVEMGPNWGALEKIKDF